MLVSYSDYLPQRTLILFLQSKTLLLSYSIRKLYTNMIYANNLGRLCTNSSIFINYPAKTHFGGGALHVPLLQVRRICASSLKVYPLLQLNTKLFPSATGNTCPFSGSSRQGHIVGNCLPKIIMLLLIVLHYS